MLRGARGLRKTDTPTHTPTQSPVLSIALPPLMRGPGRVVGHVLRRHLEHRRIVFEKSSRRWRIWVDVLVHEDDADVVAVRELEEGLLDLRERRPP